MAGIKWWEEERVAASEDPRPSLDPLALLNQQFLDDARWAIPDLMRPSTHIPAPVCHGP